ncbi:MAG: MoaD/ThiS family protein [Phycisphaerales bacterium]|nr:MoaD/ThiS family protein [Phycisphaerales bacterium]
MKHEILLLGVTRELLSTDRIAIELPEEATVAELRTMLATSHPELESVLPTCAVAIDHRYRDDATPLSRTTHEIAIVPPVSGG